VTCGVPQPQIKAACNHPPVLLLQPNDKATETMNHNIKNVKDAYYAHNTLRLFW